MNSSVTTSNIPEQLKKAVALHQSGEIDKAAKIYKQIQKLYPDNADSIHLLGLISREKGDLELSINQIERAISLSPNAATYYFNLGVACQEYGEQEKAAQAYGKCVELEPGYAEAWDNLGTIFQQNDMFVESADAHMNAVQANPQLIGAWNNLGEALRKQGLTEQALQAYQEGLEIDSKNISLLSNMANILRDQGRIEEAIQLYDKALSTENNNVPAAGRHNGKWIDSYQSAIKCNYPYADPHWNKALGLLQQGKFQEGWCEYEWRFSAGKADLTSYTYPVWQGENLSGKTVMVLAEQGIGDEIMFGSCLPDIIAMADRVIVECDKRLIPLLSRSFPSAEYIPRGVAVSQDEQGIDFQIAAGSLPGFFRNSIQDFPTGNAYLLPSADNIKKWSDRYSMLGEGTRVGISWRGGKDREMRARRSIALSEWETLLTANNIHIINLQYGDHSSEIEAVSGKPGIKIHDWPDSDPLAELDDFSAKIAALDCVVSVDNTTVHLAGAVGTACHAILPCYPDWRWLHGHDDSPWYPSIRLYRMSENNNAEVIFSRLTGLISNQL